MTDQAPERITPDWERIEADYRAGLLSLREIGTKDGHVTEGAIRKRAKKLGWTRDLGARIQAKADRSKVVLRRKEPAEAKAGFLYVIYLDSVGEKFYKIGRSSHFNGRLEAHQCSSPFDICVACAYFTGDSRGEERYWHARFADQKVRGEWFHLSPADLSEIASRSLLI